MYVNCDEVEADSVDIDRFDFKTLAETAFRIADWKKVMKRFGDFRVCDL